MPSSLVKIVKAVSAIYLFTLGLPSSDAAKVHRTKSGTVHSSHDPIHVVVNKVGPFNNPTETYRYYSLPFCMEASPNKADAPPVAESKKLEEKPEKITRRLEARVGALKHKQRLGEKLVGDRRESSPYEISFGDDVEWRSLCKTTLSSEDLMKIKNAIHNNWFFEMFIEDLPMWGYIGDVSGEDLILGETEGSRIYFYPHLHFQIGMNKNQIVSAFVLTDNVQRVDITHVDGPFEVEFSYSVEFFEEDLEWKDRMSKYHDNRFLPGSLEIHWLSIINAVVLVLLLTAFLAIILMRVLKKDLSRYMELDEQALDEDESGWKLIHGDVFRFPQYPAVFCAFVGTGVQLIISSLSIFVLALTGVVSTTKRGSILSAMIVLYYLSSIVGGYYSMRLYREMNGKQWVRNTLLTATLFPLPVVIVFMWVNTVALFHGSTSALPIGALLTIFFLYVFLSFPLTVVGGMLAKNYASTEFNAPTRTTKVAREIPTEVPWYRSNPFQVVIASMLPFSSVYIELHYIFATVWGHQIYTLVGIVFLTFILLLIVTSFITVALLYFQLAREDHRWWWVTLLNGGATGILLFLYSFFFYFHSSEMAGMLQASFYFGYMAVISFAFFLMLGSAAFIFSLIFVKRIYASIKCD